MLDSFRTKRIDEFGEKSTKSCKEEGTTNMIFQANNTPLCYYNQILTQIRRFTT